MDRYTVQWTDRITVTDNRTGQVRVFHNLVAAEDFFDHQENMRRIRRKQLRRRRCCLRRFLL